MWLVLLIMAFAAISSTCMPPFNDMRYADNATLLQVTLDQYEANPTLGWAHVFDGESPLERWPANENGIVIINYCFLNQNVKDKLEGFMVKGWEAWRSKLGNAGPGYHHRLGGFSVYNKDGVTPFCFETNGRWNEKVPVGTLVVGLMLDPQDSGGEAVMGHRPSQWDARPDRHVLRIGSPEGLPSDLLTWVAIHEMGHVLGLTHEHQRKDRDKYVHFECANLLGYAEAKTLAERSGQISITKLCTSALYGRFEPWKSLAFRAYDYATEEFWEMSHKDENGKDDGYQHHYTVTASEDYDVGSIMHYPSISGWKGGEWSIKAAPLVKWKNGGKDFTPPSEVTEENAELIFADMKNLGPSSKDIEVLKKLYPWEG
ncbi:uncharacterized protein K460DRAFT_349848 [Cucurbitaria berberidis CBS 394.84]|uniref:Metalloendopeptidase n=1 Tax=Cucurbitaria berberidis CBS 394.84 TaxID=1168544 RepID=A0A9P4GQX4_9PLEO|nr:uncharacterized protein K460DRAFT_349848 [Cucurbitaria berberidis CBS 394.84]KAF1849685.1 hypothetical protein K460DRAFT_349848 [Cucurbitaria berberidis CBS 394.84]